MSTLAIAPPYKELIEREWDRIGSPGTWLTGSQRVEVAVQARAAKADVEVAAADLSEPAVEAARTISAAAHEIRGPWVASLIDRGMTHLDYVEILGIVARLTAVDTFLFGVGQPERPLPTAKPGEPSRAIVAGATINRGWAPTVGVALRQTLCRPSPLRTRRYTTYTMRSISRSSRWQTLLLFATSNGTSSRPSQPELRSSTSASSDY